MVAPESGRPAVGERAARIELATQLPEVLETRIDGGKLLRLQIRELAPVRTRLVRAQHVLDARDRQEQRLAELRLEIYKGLDSGPAVPFDPEGLKRKGRDLLARRSNGNPG